MNRLNNNFKLFVDQVMTFRYPQIERWSFLIFCFSFIYLSLSGFFFALFIQRGLHGYFLLFHVAAGCLFAVTLTILVLLRASFFSSPDLWKQRKKSSKKRKQDINKIQAAAAWIVVVSGLFQVVSALVLMMPLFSTEVNLCITAWHRWSGLLVLLSVSLYAYHSAAALQRDRK